MTTDETEKKKASRDPESDFYNTLKKKPVLVIFKGDRDREMRGVLEWVSMYSIGVSSPLHKEGLLVGRETTLINKSDISRLKAYHGTILGTIL